MAIDKHIAHKAAMDNAIISDASTPPKPLQHQKLFQGHLRCKKATGNITAKLIPYIAQKLTTARTNPLVTKPYTANYITIMLHYMDFVIINLIALVI